jgi:flavin-dependent dehydrogenase
MRAVVIGGSLAGLCAARTLADHADQVTVVDRDRFPDHPEVRKGVPQAHHLHVLITAGQRALEQLFPGILAELYEAGAVPVAAPTDILYLTATGWRERFPATHRLVGASRELIDWTVRRRLLDDGRIRFLAAHEAVGLLGADGAVTGVRLRPRGDDGERVDELAADLVVDASGRGSHAPDWLVDLGYPPPEQTRVDAGLGYASRRYVLPDGVGEDWKNILILPEPPVSSRGGVLFPIENNRWMVTLGGMGDDQPPTEEDGFLEFARGLRSPLIHDVIKEGTPDSPIHGFLQTSNHRRHYESMPRWPSGFLVVGDAACSFNPVYGQGMSVAAQTAVALAAHLRSRPPGAPLLDRSAQAVAVRCGTAAWLIATGADLRFPTTTGARPGLRERFSHRYLDRVGNVANRDPYVSEVLTDVLHLVRPPTALVRPRVLARVLRGRPGAALVTPPAAVPAGKDGP